MARDQATYRSARRNRCIRQEHGVWGSDWYYVQHKKEVHRYEPAMKQERKVATTSGGVHELLKRGDYAGAVRKFFNRQRGAKGATGIGGG